MSSDQSHMLNTLQIMGASLLMVQLAERWLAMAVETVLKDPTLTVDKLMGQTEQERNRTLGEFLWQLKKSVRLEPKFKEDLYRFLKLRNTFVHNLSEVPGGFKLTTEKGREGAMEFLAELLALAMLIAGVFVSVMKVSGRVKADEASTDAKRLFSMMEEHFGPAARKILAGRTRKRLLVHSRGNPNK
jgi:hypothetical protein